MTQHTFENIMKHQLAKCATILHTKRQEYAPDVDVLHNFKSAAGLLGCPPREALAGMMLKHTVSLYDMCRENECRDIAVWEEKITDHMNYLILLLACVVEEQEAHTNEPD